MNPPYIACRYIDSLHLNDKAAVEMAFRDAGCVSFQQGWRPEPEAAFRPAKAAAVWTSKSLIVRADLSDDDIFNQVPAEEFNRIAIDFGDVFEIFLRPSAQESYFEFHISPNNQVFQLRIPKPGALQNMRPAFESEDAMLESFKIKSPRIETRVHVDRAARKWQVLASIPLWALAENEPAREGTKWRFSFSRYDYTRPNKEPVYSSTSPHSAINYHLVDEYGVLEFIAP